MTYTAWLESPKTEADNAEADSDAFYQEERERLQDEIVGQTELDLPGTTFIDIHRDAELMIAIRLLAEVTAKRRAAIPSVVADWLESQQPRRDDY